MSKAHDASEPAPDGLLEGIKSAALALGLHWVGLGRPTRDRLDDGRLVWRVYDDWIPTNGFAEVDASSGELLRIEQGQPDREAPEQALPGRLVPTDADIVAFARSKLLAIGWVLPEPVIVTRTSPVTLSAVWRLSSGAAANAIVVEVGGRRGNLHVRRVSRA